MPGNTRTSSSSSVPQKAVFYKEGEYWTVGLGGKTVRLKDTKGLAYLSYLFRHPAIEFHVLDLVGGIASGSDGGEVDRSAANSISGDYQLEKTGIHIGRLGDAGEVLDDKAKSAYRRRLSELREELEEAKALGKEDSAEQLEDELDALTRELSRAVGLGGRDRRAASASERARQTVSKAIKGAIERITQSDVGIGDIFSRCVKTGTFCGYSPDPAIPLAWEFASTNIESSQPSIASGQGTPLTPDQTQASPLLSILPFATAGRARFVGREAESGLIRAAIDRARNGSGSLVMLAGGPGLGKTRLASEMAEYAAANGFACFLGRCYERDDPFPYLPFVQIIEAMLAQSPTLDEFSRIAGDNAPELAQLVPRLRRVFPHTPEATELPPPQKRRYLFQSVAEALERAARTRPQLLILDDLHWADESTLALLNHLANRLIHHPLVIIGTYREEYSEHPALARTIEEFIRLGVRPLKLSGLSRDSVAMMFGQISERQVPARLVNTIFEATNGNPFFVGEVYRHLAEEGRLFDSAGEFRTDLTIDEIDVPANVRLCIMRRLNRFSADEIRALSAAAVIGRSFSFQHLAAISGADVDELFDVIEKAQQMATIVPSAEGPEKPFTFAHELVRQTLLADISIARRQQLHAKTAQAVESLNPNSAREYVGEIADHLLKAGSFADRGSVIHWLIEAGSAALNASAFEEARGNFESALSRLEPQDMRRRAELLYRVGVAQRGLGRWEEAYKTWDEAFGLFTALNDQDGAGRTCLQLAEGARWSRRVREVFTTVERFAGEASIVSSQRALLIAILALDKLDEGKFDVAAEEFSRALALAEELSDSGTKGAILAFRSQFNVQCFRLREALEDSLGSADLINAADLWIRARRLLWYGGALLHLGRVREAYEVSQELERLAIRIGHVPALLISHNRWTLVKFLKQPNLDQLEDDLQSNYDMQIGSADPAFVSLNKQEQFTVATFLRGSWHDSLAYLESAWMRTSTQNYQSLNIAMRFLAKAYSGDTEGALKLLEHGPEMVAHLGETNSHGSWALSMASIEGLYVLGERRKVATLYPVARELIDTGTICPLIPARFSQTIAGIAAAAADNWDVAEEHFQTAMRQAESFPSVLEQADIRRFHAMMLMDRAAPEDRERAQALLNDALESYQQVGMSGHIGLTQTLLDRTH